MKIRYFSILFTLIACSLKAKESRTIVYHVQEIIEIMTEPKVDAFKKENDNSFSDVIKRIKVKPLPYNETTNFDDFIEAEDYKEVDAKSLKLVEIYPNLNKEGRGFRAIKCYRIEFSKAFYSVVTTLLKSEYEMESVLINYDLNGTIIDSKVVSYDEIADGSHKTESKIETKKITVNTILWMDEKQESKEVYTIDKKGKIKQATPTIANATLSESELIDNTIEQLNLELSKVNTDLLILKTMTNNTQETIIVVPEFVDTEEYHFELNSHIVIVNNQTGKILHRYFESSKTNNWVSDAIQLREVKIDTTPYIISENIQAFGIEVYYYGQSPTNQKNNKALSLFVKSDDTLKKVLRQYNTRGYSEELNDNCDGGFKEVNRILSVSEKKTNGYFDILVEIIIEETIEGSKDKNGDCNYFVSITNNKTTLKFNGKEYTDNKK